MADELRAVLASEHRLDPEVLRRLGDGDVAELRAIAVGEVESPLRVRALGALVAATGADAIPVLGQVVTDPRQDVTARVAAAAQLGRTGPAAEPVLLTALADDDPSVRSSVLSSLGRVGGADALDALADVARRAGEPFAGQARFAATLAAFRARRRGFEPSDDRLERLAVGRAQRARLRPSVLAEADAATAVEQLRAEGFGVTLDATATLALDCGVDHLVVALDPAAARQPTEAVAAGPLLAGVVGVQSPVDESYSVRWVVLTWQGDDGAQRLAVHRPSGQAFLTGRLVAEGEAARFELASVAARGNNPVELRGSVRAGQVELEGVSTAERPVRGAPTPLTL